MASLVRRLADVQSSWGTVDAASLVLRAALAVCFIGHGAQKLFGWFGGGGISGTGEFFESVGLKPGEFLAVVAGLVEFGGGILLALGLLTTLAGLALVGDMIIAIIAVNGDKGFFTETPDFGFELNLMLIAMALAVALLGAGRFGLDGRLGLGRGAALKPEPARESSFT